MIQYKNFRQYTQLTNALKFNQNSERPFLMIYFSENSTFLEDYQRLNLKLIDFRLVAVPTTKIPRTRLLPNVKKLYRSYGLYAYSTQQKFPNNRNIIIDISEYLQIIDNTFNPSNYRQRAGFLIKNLLLKVDTFFPSNFNRIFLYSVDVLKDLNNFVDRKIFPVLLDLKKDEFRFDDLLMNVINEKGSNYRLLIKDRKFNFGRVKQYIRSVKAVDTDEEKEENVSKVANLIMKKNEEINTKNSKVISKNVPKEIINKGKIIGAIKDYLKKDENTLNKLSTGDITDSDAHQVATASILYKVSGNYDVAKKMSKSIPVNRKMVAFKAVDKGFSDELLKPSKPVNLSTDPRIDLYDLPKMVHDKSPEHIFDKRKIDFEINLKKDLLNSFKVLEDREIPLKVEKIEIKDKPQRKSEISKSDLSLVKVVLNDKFGNTHNVQIEVPKIDPSTGTFKINGQRMCLINQIIQCPITFPKPYTSRFESSYSVFRIYSRRLRREEYLEIMIATCKIPFFILLSYSFGLQETLKLYKIGYDITKEKPKKDVKFSCKLNNDSYIIFKHVDSKLKEEICQSFIHAKVDEYNIKEEFGTKKYFQDIIIKIGRYNTPFLIDSNLQNIVDPVAKQVLMNQQLPTDLNMIMKYMVENVVDGKVIDRNDITNQRIRNSEVLVNLAQKQILAAYTIYKEQVLSGNQNAKFILSSTKVISDFQQTELVQTMEYANPVEEMSTITRISPVGKKVGGIPDSNAIQVEARNTHPSYFGNIDPLDTPEGPNIGIIQQLTVDAFITSARGLISKKEINNLEGSGMLSTTTCLIPFIENNEGARIMMDGSQAKQMLPLKNLEVPFVQSGYESILTNVLSDNFIKKSKFDGKINKITEESITIETKDGEKKVIDISPVHLRSGSGKNTLSVFKPTVKIGQKIKKNNVLAEGACINNGSIALGKNLCIAYMPYKGYNFEDSVTINEKLIEEETLTSLHGIEEEFEISEKDRILFIQKIGNITKKGEPLIRRSIGEIEDLIGYEEDDSTDITGGQIIHKSPGGKIVDIEIYSNVDKSVFPQLSDLINRTNKKHGIGEKEKYSKRGIVIKGLLITFKIEQELHIGIGDKICNRYGNKGIISLIEKDNLMPRTPTGDRIDIIFNPLGILNRMNVGQIFEMYCGLISRELGRIIPKTENKKEVINILKSIISTLDLSKNQSSSNMFIKNLENLSDSNYNKFLTEVKEKGFVPVIIPPFQSPGQQQIKNALKLLNLKTSYNLYLPEFNRKTEKAVPYGYVYISKLEHIGSEKVFARSTGPIVGKSGQPTAGKRREGGQRVGELDSYSFISYNCPMLLAEFMGPLSDDHISKNEIISDIIQTGSAEYREAKISPTRDLLNSYFVSLMLNRS